MERATRADVARAAGVAPSTVSLVLNGRGPEVKIAPATIQRVQDAARDLNYIPNAAARSLRRGSSRLIALLMAELPDNPFVPVVHTVLTTAMIEIQKRGYLLLPLFQSSNDPSDAQTIRSVLGDTQLAGVIRETTSAESFTSTLLANLGIPIVAMSMINTEDTQGASALVSIDECAGVKEILSEHLSAQRRGHAVFLAGPNTNHSRQLPLEAAFGTGFTLLSLPDWDASSAYQAALRLLSENPDITLIAVADDSQAPGVFQAAIDLDRRVPQDLSILGFGNQEPASSQALGLTTVEWPLREMTQGAVEAMISAIEKLRKLSGSSSPLARFGALLSLVFRATGFPPPRQPGARLRHPPGLSAAIPCRMTPWIPNTYSIRPCPI